MTHLSIDDEAYDGGSRCPISSLLGIPLAPKRGAPSRFEMGRGGDSVGLACVHVKSAHSQ